MPNRTVQKYPHDKTDLHTAIAALIEYFDQTAETSRQVAERDKSKRAFPPTPRLVRRSGTR
jgi:hypothetical protein